MSGLDFGEVKITNKHRAQGEWWGDARERTPVEVYTEPELANSISILFAGKKAVEIAQRGWEFANPLREKAVSEEDDFNQELVVGEEVLVQPRAVHVFRHDISHGVGLWTMGADTAPFGLVVPGSGVLVHKDHTKDFQLVVSEVSSMEPLEQTVDEIIASKAIRLSSEYARLQVESAQPVLL